MYVKAPWIVTSFQTTLAIYNDVPTTELKANLGQDKSEWENSDHSCLLDCQEPVTLQVVETHWVKNQEVLATEFILTSSHFFLTSITYLQPQSLGYHAYVDAHKCHSIGPIRLCHDESTTVQPGEEAPCILATFAVAHLKGERPSEPIWGRENHRLSISSRPPQPQQKAGSAMEEKTT